MNDDDEVKRKRLDAKARRAAKRVGFIARKSRCAFSSWNQGGYTLIDADTGNTVEGAYFELSAEEIIASCEA